MAYIIQPISNSWPFFHPLSNYLSLPFNLNVSKVSSVSLPLPLSLSPSLPNSPQCINDQPDTLRFFSKFESGNLRKAVKVRRYVAPSTNMCTQTYTDTHKYTHTNTHTHTHAHAPTLTPLCMWYFGF